MRREELALAIGHADVAAEHGFSSAAAFFQGGPAAVGMRHCIRIEQSIAAPVTFDDKKFVEIDGDVCADVILAGSKLIIYGNLAGNVQASGHSEIVIAGDLKPEAKITSNGIGRLFVGGDVVGKIESSGSYILWICGTLSGSVSTGQPSTHVRVGGDCSGAIRPLSNGALLYLQVEGFMPSAALQTLGSLDYTEFNATVGWSDVPAGYYPAQRHSRKESGGNSYNRWVVQRERR